MYKFNFSSKGQIVLSILMIMAVLLAIVISIISRSVSEIKISQQTMESSKALWVAQAGLEEAITAGRDVEEKTLLGINYNVKGVDIGRESSFIFPTLFEEDETITLWLKDPETSEEYRGTKISIFWGNPGTSSTSQTTPALIGLLVYRVGSNYMSRRFAYDPNSTRRGSNSFEAPLINGCELRGISFPFCAKDIFVRTQTEVPVFLRIRMVYSSDVAHQLGVSADGNLPKQGKCFISQATVPESGITRKIQQCKYVSTIPSVFDYGLFSFGNIQ